PERPGGISEPAEGDSHPTGGEPPRGGDSGHGGGLERTAGPGGGERGGRGLGVLAIRRRLEGYDLPRGGGGILECGVGSGDPSGRDPRAAEGVLTASLTAARSRSPLRSNVSDLRPRAGGRAPCPGAG